MLPVGSGVDEFAQHGRETLKGLRGPKNCYEYPNSIVLDTTGHIRYNADTSAT
jgi:hypothetical protein